MSAVARQGIFPLFCRKKESCRIAHTARREDGQISGAKVLKSQNLTQIRGTKVSGTIVLENLAKTLVNGAPERHRQIGRAR
jgi:hypothetical protein